jgi:hypothetical protein
MTKNCQAPLLCPWRSICFVVTDLLQSKELISGTCQMHLLLIHGLPIFWLNSSIRLWPTCPSALSEEVFFIYNLNQQSEFTFYKLMFWLLQCLDGESSSGEPRYLKSGQLASFFWVVCLLLLTVVLWGAGFRGFRVWCDVCCIFGGWHLVRMICLDRRVMLHWKNIMVHLLSFWGS